MNKNVFAIVKMFYLQRRTIGSLQPTNRRKNFFKDINDVVGVEGKKKFLKLFPPHILSFRNRSELGR